MFGPFDSLLTPVKSSNSVAICSVRIVEKFNLAKQAFETTIFNFIHI